MVFRAKQIYLAEANRQLTDDRFYKRQDSDRTEEFSAPITDTLDKMYENDVVKKLLLTNCRLDQFYLLPNIPKKGMHGRPIDTAIVHKFSTNRIHSQWIYLVPKMYLWTLHQQ